MRGRTRGACIDIGQSVTTAWVGGFYRLSPSLPFALLLYCLIVLAALDYVMEINMRIGF